MSSPASIAVKVIVSVALLGGAGRMLVNNAGLKNNIKATEANIKILKSETTDKTQQRLKKKVTVSDFQRAEHDGNNVAKSLKMIMDKNQGGPKAIDNKSPQVKLINHYDGEGDNHMVLSMPYMLSGYRIQFVHGGSNDQGQVVSSFLFYNQQNQLQGMVKCKYSPRTRKFSDFKEIRNQAMQDQVNQANGQLQAQFNQKMAAKVKAKQQQKVGGQH